MARAAEQRRGVAILAEQLAERELARMAEEEHRDMVGSFSPPQHDSELLG